VRRKTPAPKPAQARSAEVESFFDWQPPKSYAAEFPHLATESAVLWDIVHRHENGLAEADAVRKVGRRFLVHRIRYSEFRLGERLKRTA